MNIFYAPILREQFNQLYRFGYTVIPYSTMALGSNLNSPSEKDCNAVVDILLSLSPFEYEEEYIVLQLLLPYPAHISNAKVTIRDIRKIYPLNERAKNFFEERLDPRIKFQSPVFQTYLEEHTLERIMSEGQNTLNEFWRLFNLSGNTNQLWAVLDIEEIANGLKARIQSKKAYNLSGEGYWTHVIAYDRYEIFPSDTLGYFYDSGQVFANFQGQQLYNLKRLFGFLEIVKNDSPKVSFKQLKEAIINNQDLEKYKDVTVTDKNRTGEKIRGYLLTPLFFQLKEQFRDVKNIKESFLFSQTEYIRSLISNVEFKALLALLSYFFGFRKFYDYLYEQPNLHIYSLNPSTLANDAILAFEDKVLKELGNRNLLSKSSQESELPINANINIESKSSHESDSIIPEVSDDPEKVVNSEIDESTLKHDQAAVIIPEISLTEAEGNKSEDDYSSLQEPEITIENNPLSVDSKLTDQLVLPLDLIGQVKSTKRNIKVTSDEEIFALIFKELNKPENIDGIAFSELKTKIKHSSSQELKDKINNQGAFDIIGKRPEKVILRGK